MQQLKIIDHRGIAHILNHVKRVLCYKDNSISVLFDGGFVDHWNSDEFSEWWLSDED